MKNLSIRKWSILGLILMAASAVTAAVLPTKAKSPNHPNDLGGRHEPSTVGGVQNGSSCVTAVVSPSCTRTDTEFTTTTGGQGTSEDFATLTNDATSDDGANSSHDGGGVE